MEPEDVEERTTTTTTTSAGAVLCDDGFYSRNARDGREDFSPSAGSLPVLQVQCSAVQCCTVQYGVLLSEESS
jgi:hypothetical protein